MKNGKAQLEADLGKPGHLVGLIRDLLKEIGEDPEREGLLRTPRRVAETLRFFTSGYAQDPRAIMEGAMFSVPYSEMVLIKDIDVYSLCEHHLLPFFGKCHIAYIPDGKIVGLSKIPKLVDAFARRLQVQEKLTVEIADTLNEVIRPLGVGVVMEAQHLCMMMRGVQKQNAYATTSSMLGAFRKDARTREEFLRLVGHPAR